MNLLRNQISFVCIHVFENSRPIKLVVHEDDGWSFLCGEIHPDSAEPGRIVGAGHLFDRDASLGDIKDLPLNWEAERAYVGGRWTTKPLPSS